MWLADQEQSFESYPKEIEFLIILQWLNNELEMAVGLRQASI